MKKIFTLLFWSCFIGTVANAQGWQSQVQQLRQGRWQLMLAPDATDAAAKTSATKESRLSRSAYGVYKNGGFPFIDSSYYSYSFERGFDKSIGWLYDSTTKFRADAVLGRVYASRSFQTFNTSGKVATNEIKSWDQSSGSWMSSSRMDFTYAGNVLSYYVQSMWNGSSYQNYMKYEVNTNTLLFSKTTLQQEWLPATSRWKYSTREVTKYANAANLSNGLPDSIIRESWDGSVWVPNMRAGFTNINGKAMTIETSVLSSGVWTPTTREENTYDGTTGWLASVITYNYDNNTSAWTTGVRESYTYDNNGNRTGLLYETWNGTAFVNTGRITTTFNTYNQPLVQRQETWSEQFNMWIFEPEFDYEIRNYYEEYTTDVKVIAKRQLAVYPTPATHVLNVVLPAGVMNPSFQLTDMTGRIVMYVKPVATDGKIEIDVTGLPVGNYILKMDAPQLNTSQLISIAR